MARHSWRNSLRGCLLLGVATLLLVVVLVGWLLHSRRPPLEDQRQALADQMGLRLDRLSFCRETRFRVSFMRVWHYRPSDAQPLGVFMSFCTMNGKFASVGCHEYLPSLTSQDNWTSPVTLPGEPGIEALGARGRGSQSDLVTPEEQVQDQAVIALASVLGLPVKDGDGRIWQPRLTWEGSQMGYPAHLQTVDVTLRLRSRDRGIPHLVRVALIPETRQLSHLVVDRW